MLRNLRRELKHELYSMRVGFDATRKYEIWKEEVLVTCVGRWLTQHQARNGLGLQAGLRGSHGRIADVDALIEADAYEAYLQTEVEKDSPGQVLTVSQDFCY
ncbi:hypothetical protein HDU90_008479 [Geranomyces variabilis]|nr:hypothetical protein HDU90_008479 [Geranomyces variabilis]